MFMCLCKGVRRQQILEVLEQEEQSTLEQVQQACGAGSDCGSCQRRLQKLIAQYSNDEGLKESVDKTG